MNAFEEADAWVPSNTLDPGDHLVTIASAVSTQTGNYPQTELELSNTSGSIKDWITTMVPSEHKKGSSIGIQQIAALFDAAGVARPKEGEFDPGTMRIHQTALNRLAGKRVRIIVRREKNNKPDPETGVYKEYNRVKGYLSPAGGPSDGADQTDAMRDTAPVMTAGAVADDDDIPF